MNYFVGLIGFTGWLAGVVLAAGVWGTAFAICVPFYAWYLVVERAMRMAGFI